MVCLVLAQKLYILHMFIPLKQWCAVYIEKIRMYEQSPCLCIPYLKRNFDLVCPGHLRILPLKWAHQHSDLCKQWM